MLKNTDRTFEDVLDDEFINIFKPIFYFQSLFGMRGVTIEYKFVTSSTVLYKTYCCVIWMVNSACMVNTAIRCNSQFDYLSTDIPLKAGILMNGCINIFLAWKSVFFQGHTNSQLYVKLQRIERILRIKDSKQTNTRLAKITATLSIIAMIAFAGYIVVFNQYIIEGFCPTGTISCVVCTMSYYQMSLVIIMLFILMKRARYVNVMLLQKDNYLEIDKVFPSIVWQPKEKISNEILEGMCCILDTFADVMEVFQHAISFFTFLTLMWQLILMQNLVNSIKLQMSVNIPSLLCIMPASAVFMVLMLTLCLISQSLTTTLEKTKQICTKCTLSCDGKSRENAKLMILLLDGKREAIVCDIFKLDTQLLLHLFSITASYTIVLLQFAVL